MNCRHCFTPLKNTVIDLGSAPPSNAYLSAESLEKPEKSYPLIIKVCTECWLVQTEDYVDPKELFSSDYAYFSSTSRSWLMHAAKFCEEVQKRLDLNLNSLVIEVASNDGYLLRNFVANGVPCIGIEPTDSTAKVAGSHGVNTIREFFCEKLGKELASRGNQASLIVANNVFAHVPDINDFTLGLKAALRPEGTIVLEFPHLLRLIDQIQFDTIYHEHYSYLSLETVRSIFSKAGLKVVDVEELSTHGGSLRVFGCHSGDSRDSSPAVFDILRAESSMGLTKLATYLEFQKQADQIRNDFLDFLVEKKKEGCSVVGYGAAAKGNTLINYSGVTVDLLPFICDAALSKQGMYMPGSHIPIKPPSVLSEKKPDYVVIFPWNLADEIKNDVNTLLEKPTKFVTAIPCLKMV
ncbi:MAG: class I SAM-dependent methyltransferase [Halieaceae bacterium]|nr:class I SAM-dependent methyltransferase [Halieaceae bacterium]